MSQKNVGTQAGTQTFTILGVEVTVDFNDRDLAREVLDIYAEFEALKGADKTGIEAARLSLDIMDRCDAAVTRAVGQTARDKMFGRGKRPLREPVVALYALVTPCGEAYDAMLKDLNIPGA